QSKNIFEMFYKGSSVPSRKNRGHYLGVRQERIKGNDAHACAFCNRRGKRRAHEQAVGGGEGGEHRAVLPAEKLDERQSVLFANDPPAHVILAPVIFVKVVGEAGGTVGDFCRR